LEKRGGIELGGKKSGAGVGKHECFALGKGITTQKKDKGNKGKNEQKGVAP